MKILIIHTAFIGDIILSTPLVQVAKKKYKNSTIHYLTQPIGKAILNNNPNIDKFFVYDKNGKDKGFRNYIKLVKQIKLESYDLAIVPHRYLRSISIARFAKIPQIIGFDISDGAFMLTKKIKYDKNKHEIERLLDLVDYQLPPKVLPSLFPSEKDFEKIENILKNQRQKKQFDKIIVVSPGSKWFTKMWPSEYYNKLVRKLSENENLLTVISGSKEEKNLLIDTNYSDNILDLRGEISLMEFSALISKSDIIISNDSSPIHIASAFPNVFIIGIYGPTVKQLGFFPYSENSFVFENNDLPCRPCGKHGHDKCPKKHFNCMHSISVDSVYQKIYEKIIK